jgi:hypothetical protein
MIKGKETFSLPINIFYYKSSTAVKTILSLFIKIYTLYITIKKLFKNSKKLFIFHKNCAIIKMRIE